MLLNLTDLVAFFLCIINSDVINEGIDYQFFHVRVQMSSRAKWRINLQHRQRPEGKRKTKAEAMKQWHTREQSSQVSEIINVSLR